MGIVRAIACGIVAFRVPAQHAALIEHVVDVGREGPTVPADSGREIEGPERPCVRDHESRLLEAERGPTLVDKRPLHEAVEPSHLELVTGRGIGLVSRYPWHLRTRLCVDPKGAGGGGLRYPELRRLAEDRRRLVSEKDRARSGDIQVLGRLPVELRFDARRLGIT